MPSPGTSQRRNWPRTRHRGAALVRGTALAAAACVVAACTGSGSTASLTIPTATQAGTSRYPAGYWAQFDQNAARTGAAVGVGPAGKLRLAWTARLDGAVYGQPLVIGGDIIAATENDSIYALDRATGKVVWRAHLGTPVPKQDLHHCGDIFPLGITGTPVYDQADGLVYAVAETTGYHHVLFGVAVTDGAVEVRRDIDIDSAANHADYNQQRPGLAIDDGRVYATFGGLAGDCGQYVGSIVGVPLSGSGPLVSWHTPTSREGAVWGPGGPVTGPDGDLWISSGNGAARAGQPYDGSDSVTSLTPDLKRTGFFAPSTWPADNARDLDLGSTQPVLAAGNTAFVLGKRGVGYLLSATRLGGVGGQLAERPICKALGAASVSGYTVYEPCVGGMAAISVDAAARRIRVLWRGPANSNGSPVTGGGAVWVTAYSKRPTGTLYELNPATGAIEQQIAIHAGLPHFSSLSLYGDGAYLGTLNGVTAIDGA